MKDKHLMQLFRKDEWWEEFLDWDFASKGFLGFGERYITLVSKETGKEVGRADSFRELNEVAEAVMNTLFEKEILNAKT